MKVCGGCGGGVDAGRGTAAAVSDAVDGMHRTRMRCITEKKKTSKKDKTHDNACCLLSAGAAIIFRKIRDIRECMYIYAHLRASTFSHTHIDTLFINRPQQQSNNTSNNCLQRPCCQLGILRNICVIDADVINTNVQISHLHTLYTLSLLSASTSVAYACRQLCSEQQLDTSNTWTLLVRCGFRPRAQRTAAVGGEKRSRCVEKLTESQPLPQMRAHDRRHTPVGHTTPGW